MFSVNKFYFSVADVDCVRRINMRPRMMITEDHMITSADNAPATTESSSVNIHTFMQLFYLRINDIKTSAPGSSLKYLSHFLPNSEFPSAVLQFSLLLIISSSFLMVNNDSTQKLCLLKLC